VDVVNPPFQAAFLRRIQGNETLHGILDIKDRDAVLPFDIDRVRASQRRLSYGQITEGAGGSVPAARPQDGWKSNRTEVHPVPAMVLLSQSFTADLGGPIHISGPLGDILVYHRRKAEAVGGNRAHKNYLWHSPQPGGFQDIDRTLNIYRKSGMEVLFADRGEERAPPLSPSQRAFGPKPGPGILDHR